MKALYDSYDYTHYWQGRVYENQAEQAALKRFLNQIPYRQSLIDIGAGFGRLTPIYATKFEKSLLVDPSEKLLAIAKKNLKKYLGLSFARGEVENLPVDNHSFEVAVFIRVSHHLDNLEPAIKEIIRVLKPKGFLIFEFANKIHIKSALKAIILRKFDYLLSHLPQNISTEKKVPFKNYHPSHIKTLLLANGFEIIKTRSVSNFRHPLFKKIIPLPVLLRLDRLHSILTEWLIPFYGPSIFVLAQKK